MADDVNGLFEPFSEDSQLSVYAAELEVRPPAVPTNERRDWSVAQLNVRSSHRWIDQILPL